MWFPAPSSRKDIPQPIGSCQQEPVNRGALVDQRPPQHGNCHAEANVGSETHGGAGFGANTPSPIHRDVPHLVEKERGLETAPASPYDAFALPLERLGYANRVTPREPRPTTTRCGVGVSIPLREVVRYLPGVEIVVKLVQVLRRLCHDEALRWALLWRSR